MRILAMFTSGEIIALMVQAGILFTVVGGVIISIRNSGHLKEVKDISTQSKTKIDETQVEVQAVAGHVNGAASAASAKIDALQGQVTMLMTLLAEKKQDAALLAQAVAQSANPITPLPVIIANSESNPVPTTTNKTP